MTFVVSLLQNQAKMLDFPAISNRDREGHMNWLWNTQALVPKEMQYIRQDDVVSLYKREDYTPLEVFVERVIGRICGKVSSDPNLYFRPARPPQCNAMLTTCEKNHSFLRIWYVSFIIFSSRFMAYSF